MNKNSELLLDGKPFNFARATESTTDTLKRFLDGQPVKNFFSASTLEQATGVSDTQIRKHARTLSTYCHQLRGNRWVWGNPKAIARLRELLAGAK